MRTDVEQAVNELVRSWEQLPLEVSIDDTPEAQEDLARLRRFVLAISDNPLAAAAAAEHVARQPVAIPEDLPLERLKTLCEDFRGAVEHATDPDRLRTLQLWSALEAHPLFTALEIPWQGGHVSTYQVLRGFALDRHELGHVDDLRTVLTSAQRLSTFFQALRGGARGRTPSTPGAAVNLSITLNTAIAEIEGARRQWRVLRSGLVEEEEDVLGILHALREALFLEGESFPPGETHPIFNLQLYRTKFERLVEAVVDRLRAGHVEAATLRRLTVYLERFAKVEILGQMEVVARKEDVLQAHVDRFLFQEGFWPLSHVPVAGGETDTFVDDLEDSLNRAAGEAIPPLLLELKQVVGLSTPSAYATEIKTKLRDARHQLAAYHRHLSSHPRWANLHPRILIAHDATRPIILHGATDCQLVHLSRQPPSKLRGEPLTIDAPE